MNKTCTFLVLREPERLVGIQWSKLTANRCSYAGVQERRPKRFYKMFCHEQK